MGQPDLDFMAPEVQTQSVCSPASDVFSLGLLVAYLCGQGRPLISANLNTSTYLRQLDTVSEHSYRNDCLFGGVHVYS